jgi:putative toxin-antitoxin system antitoxin component (TIGR02293 family)
MMEDARASSDAPETPGSSLDGLTILGLRARSTLELLEKVERGFSYATFVRLQRAIDVPAQELADFVQIPARTLLRRKETGRLRSDESDRVLRVSRLLERAIELFEGNAEAARNWLASPAKALAGHTPLDFARTEAGAREVESLIGRLEHGVNT